LAISFVGAAAAISGASQPYSDAITWPDATQTDLVLAVFGFEGVAGGSGPYIDYDPSGVHGTIEGNGWVRLLYQAPSASGNALEVWAAFRGTGTSTSFLFTGSYSYVARGLQYRGEYNPGGGSYVDFVNGNGTVRAYSTAQVTGNNPAAPSVYAFANEMVIALGSDQLQSPGFGTPTSPTGFTNEVDSARGGSFGNVEITAADKLATIEGLTGSITWTATASTGTTKGTTATLVVRPASGSSSPPTTTAPLLNLEWAV